MQDRQVPLFKEQEFQPPTPSQYIELRNDWKY